MTILQIIMAIYIIGVSVAFAILMWLETNKKIEYTTIFLPEHVKPLFFLMMAIMWPIILVDSKYHINKE